MDIFEQVKKILCDQLDLEEELYFPQQEQLLELARLGFLVLVFLQR